MQTIQLQAGDGEHGRLHSADARCSAVHRGDCVGAMQERPRATHPPVSKDGARGAAPWVLTTPWLGRKPGTPQKEAGTRTEPAVSPPSANATSPDPTSACGAGRQAGRQAGVGWQALAGRVWVVIPCLQGMRGGMEAPAAVVAQPPAPLSWRPLLRPALTAHPLLLPPGSRPGAAGFSGQPWKQFCPEKSYASSVMAALPARLAPPASRACSGREGAKGVACMHKPAHVPASSRCSPARPLPHLATVLCPPHAEAGRHLH